MDNVVDSAYESLKFLIIEYRETIKSSFFEIRSSSEIGDIFAENLINQCTNTIEQIERRTNGTPIENVELSVQTLFAQMQGLLSTINEGKESLGSIT